MRQHVNPLRRFFQLYIEIPNPEDLFADSSLPIHLDIGCAKGSFLLDYARKQNQWNFLGIDIRDSLVKFAERERKKLELNNLKFLFCNANVSLENWLLRLESNSLKRVSIQFPDPWFKKRHHKRRVLQPSLLFSLAAAMEPGSELFLQSDIYSVIQPMVELIQQSECFENISHLDSYWLRDNPLHVNTEREKYVLLKGLPVYRVLFYRNKKTPSRILNNYS